MARGIITSGTLITFQEDIATKQSPKYYILPQVLLSQPYILFGAAFSVTAAVVFLKMPQNGSRLKKKQQEKSDHTLRMVK